MMKTDRQTGGDYTDDEKWKPCGGGPSIPLSSGWTTKLPNPSPIINDKQNTWGFSPFLCGIALLWFFHLFHAPLSFNMTGWQGLL